MSVVNWKSFLPESESENFTETQTAEDGFIEQDTEKDRVTETDNLTKTDNLTEPDWSTIVEENQDIKALLEERDKLESMMQGLTGNSQDEKTQNPRFAYADIASIKEKKADFNQWMQKKDQTNKHALEQKKSSLHQGSKKENTKLKDPKSEKRWEESKQKAKAWDKQSLNRFILKDRKADALHEKRFNNTLEKNVSAKDFFAVTEKKKPVKTHNVFDEIKEKGAKHLKVAKKTSTDLQEKKKELEDWENRKDKLLEKASSLKKGADQFSNQLTQMMPESEKENMDLPPLNDLKDKLDAIDSKFEFNKKADLLEKKWQKVAQKRHALFSVNTRFNNKMKDAVALAVDAKHLFEQKEKKAALKQNTKKILQKTEARRKERLQEQKKAKQEENKRFNRGL